MGEIVSQRRAQRTRHSGQLPFGNSEQRQVCRGTMMECLMNLMSEDFNPRNLNKLNTGHHFLLKG